MARFYFNVRNDLVVDDEEGVELDDLHAARELAIESARVLVCESVKLGHLNLDHYIEVLDEERQPVLTLTFRDAFRISG